MSGDVILKVPIARVLSEVDLNWCQADVSIEIISIGTWFHCI